jgi:hypothetical protein
VGPSGTAGYEQIDGPVTPLSAGSNAITVPIPVGKVPTGGGLNVTGNDGTAIHNVGPDSSGNWHEDVQTPDNGGTAQAIVFVIDAPPVS